MDFCRPVRRTHLSHNRPALGLPRHATSMELDVPAPQSVPPGRLSRSPRIWSISGRCGRHKDRYGWPALPATPCVFQALHSFLLGIQIGTAADGKRLLCKEISQDLLCQSSSPYASSHLVTRFSGIEYFTDRYFRRSSSFFGKLTLSISLCNGAKHTVYKRLKRCKSPFSVPASPLHCTQRVRHTVHILQLVYRASQDFPDGRLHSYPQITLEIVLII